MTLRDKLKFWILLSNYIEKVVQGTSPLSLPDAIADSLSYVKAFGGTEQRNLPDNYIERQFIYMMDGSYLLPNITPEADWHIEMDFQTTSVSTSGVRNYFGSRYVNAPVGAGIRLAHTANGYLVLYGFDTTNPYTGSGGSYKIQSNTRYKYVYNNNSASISTGGTVVDSTTFTVDDTTTREVAINTYTSSDTWGTATEGIYLYSFKAWNGQGELVIDLVPAVQRGTVPLVGFYDMVSKTFKTATVGTFAAGGEAVPSPITPMDIVSNNGVLKVRHQSGLPWDYTLLDYLESDGTQEIRLPFDRTSGHTYKAEFDWEPTAYNGGGIFSFGADYLGYQISPYSSGGNGIGFSSSNKILSSGRVQMTATQSSNGLTMTLTDGVSTVTHTRTTANYSYRPSIFSAWSSARGSVKIYGFKFYQDDTLLFDLIPAIHNGVNGMYNKVDGTFLEAYVGTLISGNPVNDIEIYTDGTVETIKDTLNNTATAETLLKVGDYQDVQSIIDGVVTRKVGVKVLDGTEDWYYSAGWSDTTHKCFYVTPLTDIKQQTSSSNECLCSHFEWYSRDDLYADKTIIGGCISGYLPTNPESGRALTLRISSSVAVDATAFKSWLAAQYNAGTPVIIVYPLATETTESVAGQTLQVQTGDNTLEITQASLNNLELEAKYKKVE